MKGNKNILMLNRKGWNNENNIKRTV
jgi:hypothetical protein